MHCISFYRQISLSALFPYHKISLSTPSLWKSGYAGFLLCWNHYCELVSQLPKCFIFWQARITDADSKRQPAVSGPWVLVYLRYCWYNCVQYLRSDVFFLRSLYYSARRPKMWSAHTLSPIVRSLYKGACRFFAAGQGSGRRSPGRTRSGPVSYTHLTLPTTSNV